MNDERTFPLARSVDVPYRHVHQAKLLGQEFAVWRDDSGHVNLWENRCVHRGVRLSIGLHLGDKLRCQYHGWEYAAGSGSCTSIPAHPAMAVPIRVAVKTFTCEESGGLIWASMGGTACPPSPFSNDQTVVSPVTVLAPQASVEDALQTFEWPWFDPQADLGIATQVVPHAAGPGPLRFELRGPWGAEQAIAHLQPIDLQTTAIYFEVVAPSQPLHVVHRRYLYWARQLAARVESREAARPAE